MGIDVADAHPSEIVIVYETNHFRIGRHDRARQILKRIQNDRPLS